MKLQKLAYYAQAWHLVWEEEALFREPIQAWANGPVIPDLYQAHKGNFMVSSVRGHSEELSNAEKSSVDAVLTAYGKFTAQQLSEMTHREQPWQQARRGVPEGSRSSSIITPASMHEYYHGLHARHHG
ncbi:DUF4065 domain-containing protein [Paenarthrobacter sp. AT5]|nr:MULTISPECIES: type II toxin-antitoxin system antitoxin SocA domain-containing protein [Paenarthrobacter]WOC62321.1 DUF4065 domain-containing protein [Paenarthrobacter sp. AT5]